MLRLQCRIPASPAFAARSDGYTPAVLQVTPFQLDALIGKGGMGRVWRAKFLGPDLGVGLGADVSAADVAVKVMTADRARNPTYIEAFRREIRAIARLNHPNVLVVLDYGEVSDAAAAASGGELVARSPWLAMELARHGNLTRRCGTVDWATARRILLQVLDALAHAHARGVIHRDIKPSNILFGGAALGQGVVARNASLISARPGARGPSTQAKLADFGVSRTFRDEEPWASSKGVVGTPAYMAPEQFRGVDGEFGPWTDLYALGCVAYELVCGVRPFELRGSFRAMHQAHATWPCPPLRPVIAVPNGLESWIHRLMAKDARVRFRMAADAAWALESLGDPVVGPVSTAAGFAVASAEVAEAPDGPIADPRTVGDTVDTASIDTVPSLFADTPLPAAPWEEDLSEPSNDTEPSQDASPDARPPLDAFTAADKLRANDNEWRSRPVPATWSSSETETTRLRLTGAGLSLYQLRTIPLVAREAERDRLWEAVGRVTETARAHVISLEGPAGTGKSRLARWLCERSHELGVAVFLSAVHGATASAADGLVPMFLRALECSGASRSEVRARLERKHPRLFESTSQDAGATLVDILSPRDSTVGSPASVWANNTDERYEAIRRMLADACVERPLILWLDDVAWAPDALGFVEYLQKCQTQTPSPILVVTTARSEELAFRSAERQRLRAITEADDAQTLVLGPLPAESQPRFTEEVLGLQGDLAALVQTRTAGNPLFAVQLVGEWVQRGLLEATASGFQLREGAEPSLPDSLSAVWSERIDRLLASRPEADEVALGVAAVLGRYVRNNEWRAACERLGVSTAGLSQVLEEQCLAQSDRESGWSFVHGMLHESLEGRVRERGAWRDYHAAVAETLARRSSRGAPSRLGRHLLEAGQAEDGARHLIEGMRQHLGLGELGQAQVTTSLIARALDEAALPASDRLRGEAALLDAQLAREQGRIDAAGRSVSAALRIAESLGAQDLACRALTEGALTSYRAGDLDAVMERSESGERLAEASGQPEFAARCLEVRGRALTDRGRLDEAKDAYVRAGRVYEKMNDYLSLASCGLGLGWVALTRGDFDEARRLIRGALSECERLGGRVLAAVSFNMLGEVERMSGDLKAAERSYQEAIRRHRACGSIGKSAVVQLNLAIILIEREQYARAKAAVSGVIETMQATGAHQFLGAAHLMLLACAASEERWDEWDERFARATELLDESGQVYADLARLTTIAGRLARDAGQKKKSDDAYTLAGHQWRTLGQTERAAACDAELTT